MRRSLTLTAFLGAGLLFLASCLGDPDIFEPTPIEETKFAPSLNVDLDEMTKHPEGLYYQDLVVGEGMAAVDSSKITVKYWGYLADGTLFDSSEEHPNKVVEFDIGVGKVIAGWDLGVPGMREGGKRKLVIPYYLGYGSRGRGKIPPYATLVFDIELIKVVPPPPPEPQ